MLNRSKILLVTVGAAILSSGCGEDGSKEQLAAILQEVTNYSETIDEQKFSMLYGTCDDATQSLLDACISHMEVSVCTTDSNGLTKAELSVPDLSSYNEFITEDSGYVNDLRKLDDADASEDEIREYVIRYLVSLVMLDKIDTKQVQVELKLSDDSISECSYFSEYASEIIENVEKIVPQTNVTVGDDSGEEILLELDNTSDILNGCKKISIGQCFVINQDSARYLIYDLEIITGSDAQSILSELSPVNSGIITNGVLYYLTYKVKVLTEGEHAFSSDFVLTDDTGYIYKSMGVAVTGLRDLVVASQGDVIDMSDCLVGPPDAHLVWCSENGNGTYEISM
ncbi:hypothetical protein AALB53_13915 [Lachnospiraceae bacterium 47-T17]